MTLAEIDKASELHHGAMPGFESLTGLRPFREAELRVIINWDASMTFVIRPLNAHDEPDPDRWWIWDADVDESEGWVPQAVRTIVYDEPESPALTHAMATALDDDDVVEFLSTPVSAPRNPKAPVTSTIELDDHETADREGLRAWEEHEHFAVLVTESGFAVVNTSTATGIVRYPDKTACVIRAPIQAEARIQAEKYLAKRPYTTAYERVLGEAEFDVEEEPPREVAKPAPAQVRPKPGKRAWATVPIQSSEEDD